MLHNQNGLPVYRGAISWLSPFRATFSRPLVPGRGEAAFFVPRRRCDVTNVLPGLPAGCISRAPARNRASAASEPAHKPERAAGGAEALAAPVLPSPALLSSLSGAVNLRRLRRADLDSSIRRGQEGSSLHPRPALVRGRARGLFCDRRLPSAFRRSIARGGVARRWRVGSLHTVRVRNPYWSAPDSALQSAAIFRSAA